MVVGQVATNVFRKMRRCSPSSGYVHAHLISAQQIGRMASLCKRAFSSVQSELAALRVGVISLQRSEVKHRVARNQPPAIAHVKRHRKSRGIPASAQSVGCPRRAGIRLSQVGPLPRELVGQGNDRAMPELDFDVIEHAVDNLTSASVSLILRNKVEEREPAQSACLVKHVPAGHGLPREVEKRIKPGRIAACENSMSLRLRNDRGDLRTKGHNSLQDDGWRRCIGAQSEPASDIPGKSQPALHRPQTTGPEPISCVENARVNRHDAPQFVPVPLADYLRYLSWFPA